MSGRLLGMMFGLAAGAALAAGQGGTPEPPPVTVAPPPEQQIVDWSEFLGQWAAVQEVGALVSAQTSAPTPCSGPATPHVMLCSVVKSDAPLITPATDPRIGNNIAMPSVVKMPSWLPNKLGNYYMYFAAHNGHYIRLAYADSPIGPWTNYAPGSLKDTDVAPFSKTISSPDVFVLRNPDRVRMYFSTDIYAGSAQQWSGVAESRDGINFTLASTENIAKYYLRVWPWMGKYYGLFKGWSTAPAELAESPNGTQRFVTQQTFTAHGSIRHMAVLIKDDIALIFYSKIGEAPERILLSTMKMSGPASSWQLSAPIEVLRPTLAYEGANYAIGASDKGSATNVNQVRDPYILEDGGKTYLYYSIAGESGIAVAELTYKILAGGATPPPPPPPSPTVTLNASPTNIASGTAANLTWSSQNTSSCTASGGWSGTRAVSGTASVTPTQTTTYTLNCSGPSGSTRASTTVSVSGASPPIPKAISIGGRVLTTAAQGVRATAPKGSIVGTQPAGAAGTVKEGPVVKEQTWWKVNYDTGVDGWTSAKYLTAM